MRFITPAGVIATLFSLFFTSFGTPIRMLHTSVV
jgi:hypothetical protein